MTGVWDRLEEWLARNAPDARADLRPGASPQEMKSIEDLVGAKLPDAFREVYAVHDGQVGVGPPALINWTLLPAKSIKSEWSLMRDLNARGALSAPAIAEGPVRAVWWDVNWIPVAGNGSGDFQCLDLDPPDAGRRGQIITFSHTDGRRVVAADSLINWIEACAVEFESGAYHLKDGEWVSDKGEQTRRNC